jgi:iron(II)-dependent oxidoreductase
MTQRVSASYLIATLQDARARTLELVNDLDQEQLMGPKLPGVNPLRWEIGHIAYFYEFFILRSLYGHDSILGLKADELYDSIAVAHDTRWDLPLLSMTETLAYMNDVLEKVCAHLVNKNEDGLASEQDSFIYQFGAFHEDMHTEAFIWGRQTLGYPSPTFSIQSNVDSQRSVGSWPGFVKVPGGKFKLGANQDSPFIFDNEKWAHAVEVNQFEIAKAPITCSEFAAFVNDGGYQSKNLWPEDVWLYMKNNDINHPAYWVPTGADKWDLKQFDKIIPLPDHAPVSHVTWYEANAYCQWAGVRLPSELEWEVAALGDYSSTGNLSFTKKRRYPWGDTPPNSSRANLDGRALGCIDVAALADGDSAFGCRQMLGNVWEWTADTFNPYPGFKADAYKEYSEMLFGSTKVLRGGAWTTRSRMMHGTYRNFFEPHRWNIFSGFRVCKL